MKEDIMFPRPPFATIVTIAGAAAAMIRELDQSGHWDLNSWLFLIHRPILRLSQLMSELILLLGPADDGSRFSGNITLDLLPP